MWVTGEGKEQKEGKRKAVVKLARDPTFYTPRKLVSF